MTEPAPTPAPTPTPAPAPTPAPWYQGKLDGELLGHAQTMGWDKKSADEAAIDAFRAHREARSYIGVPESRLIRLPADPAKAPDEMRAVWQRLGAPKEAKDYDFTSVKRADGSAIDQTLGDTMRKTAFDLNVPKDVATGFAQSVVKLLDGTKAEEAATATAKLAESKAALTNSWGKNFEANKFIASQAAQKLGIPPEAVSALEKVAGYDKVMEMFRTIGVKMGEDKFVAGDRPAQDGIMSKEQAQSRLTELKADTDFGKRLLANGSTERREWDALHKLLYGEQAA